MWRERALRVGFKVWRDRVVAQMSEREIEEAFDGLSRYYGISYIWQD